MKMHLLPADAADLPTIVALMNAAFRGAASERNWSVESGYITGDRTSEALLREEIGGGAAFLLVKDEITAALQGCVSLQALSPGRWYLGSLTVDPALQNTGFGRELLRAAETYISTHGGRAVEITVVTVRETLIAWYERRGYISTGETRPFPYEDNRFGTPLRDDLHFAVLEKRLTE